MSYKNKETEALLAKIFERCGHVDESNCPKEWVRLCRELQQERDHYKRLLDFIGDTNQSVCQITMPRECIEAGEYMLEPSIEAAIRLHERLKEAREG